MVNNINKGVFDLINMIESITDLIEKLHNNKAVIDAQYAQINPELYEVKYSFALHPFKGYGYEACYLVYEGIVAGMENVLPSSFKVKIEDLSKMQIQIRVDEEVSADKLENKLKEIEKELKKSIKARNVDINILISYTAKDEEEFNNIREFLESIPEDSGKKPEKGSTYFCYD